jgi:hypothetical protein
VISADTNRSISPFNAKLPRRQVAKDQLAFGFVAGPFTAIFLATLRLGFLALKIDP